MEIAIVGAAAAVTLGADGTVTAARIAITALAPVIHRVDGGRGGPRRAPTAATRRPRRPVPRQRAGRPRPSPTSGARPTTAGRWPPSSRAARSRTAVPDAPGASPSPSPRATRPSGAERPVAVDITLTVNGGPLPARRSTRTRACSTRSASDVGLTGSKEGCDDSECGACMMLVDGRPVNSCSYLAVQADGAGSPPSRAWPTASPSRRSRRPSSTRAVSSAVSARPGCSSPRRPCCGTPDPTDDEIRIALSGNLCRCTGYDGIRSRRSPRSAEEG